MDSALSPRPNHLAESNESVGPAIYALASRLFPICRSITGNGVRETINILREHIDLELHEVATGTQVFDWVIPPEWNIRDAYIKDAAGRKIVDFARSNLHVMSYSRNVHKVMPLGELKAHIHTLPEQPDVIPYK